MAMEEVNIGGIRVSTFGFAVIGILSAAIMLLIYHCILMRSCNRGNPLSLPSRQFFPPHGEGTPSSIDNSFIQLIPAYKYGKLAGKSGEGENICSVCLCEFKEGEDVRRLPHCSHSFHAPCIDMWLYSHFNCPLCRAEMTPSPLLSLRRSPPPDAGGLPRIGGG